MPKIAFMLRVPEYFLTSYLYHKINQAGKIIRYNWEAWGPRAHPVTMTLIGDPANILIGSYAKLTFAQFVVNLALVCTVCLTLTSLCYYSLPL